MSVVGDDKEVALILKEALLDAERDKRKERLERLRFLRVGERKEDEMGEVEDDRFKVLDAAAISSSLLPTTGFRVYYKMDANQMIITSGGAHSFVNDSILGDFSPQILIMKSGFLFFIYFI